MPRRAAPRRAVPDAGDVSTWRALPARHRGNRPVPAALGPPPARRRASVPSRRQRGTPRHQLHPGPIPAAPLRPAPPGACGAPRGRLKGTGTGRPAASDPQRDGTGRRYLETWMVAGPGPAAPRSDMAAPAPASDGTAAAAALNRDRPPRPAPRRAPRTAPAPPVRRGRSRRCARGYRAGALRGAALCGGPGRAEPRSATRARRGAARGPELPVAERQRVPAALEPLLCVFARLGRSGGQSRGSPRPAAPTRRPRGPAPGSGAARVATAPRRPKPLPGRSRHRGRAPAPPRASLPPGRSLGAPPAPRAGSHRHVEVETLLRCSRSQKHADLPRCPAAGSLIATARPSVRGPATKLLCDPHVPGSAAPSPPPSAPHGVQRGHWLPRPPAVQYGTPAAHE